MLTQLGAVSVGKLQQMYEQSDVNTVAVLNDAADQVFAVSQRFVPVDTGYLKGSGRVDYATRRMMEAAVAYVAEYALIVHEIHASQSHYLTRALDRVVDNLPADVADRIVASVT